MNIDICLTLTEVTKDYPAAGGREPLRVLDSVSLSLAAGDRLAILGPSGSGKSTLLNIVGTLDRPSAGQVRFGTTDPFALSASALARFRCERIGFVFQDHHLLSQCTALENVLLARLACGMVTKADVARATELLSAVGLEERVHHRPAELSGGERQRVAIARALMNRPAVLLADEPTGNLDSATADSVGGLLLDLAEQANAIVIVATHSHPLAERVGRQLRLTAGRLQ